MAYMMDSMMGGYFGYPFFSWGFGLIWLILFLVIAYFVYKDADSRRMNGLLGAILGHHPDGGITFPGPVSCHTGNQCTERRA